MAKYLKLFENHTSYEEYINGPDAILPNVSYCEDVKDVYFNPELPQHDYVEIGGVKWATMNLGATAVTDYGKYYAWGETQGYTASQVGTDKNFSWSDYELCDGTSSNMTKYNNTDQLTVLESGDDAVTSEWGGNWRMPTWDEWQALVGWEGAANTAWTTDYEGSGVRGIVCTDKTDPTKVLFFPCNGYYLNGSIVDGSAVYCWTSSVFMYEGYAYHKVFTDAMFSDGQARCAGLSIRGVLDENS